MKRTLCLWMLPLLTDPVWADELSDLRAQVQTLTQQLQSLRDSTEARIAALEAALGAAATESTPSTAQPAPGPIVTAPAPQPGTSSVPYYGGSSGAKLFNPETAMIGNFLGTAGRSGGAEGSSASFREGELGLQAIVDPYARADFFLAFGEEGVEVEEAYLTFAALPTQTLAKIGRMRASFGKVNTHHLDALPSVDYPLPILNLLASDEGLIGSGVSLSHFLPAPGDLFAEGTLEIFRGEAEGLFESERKRDLFYLGHLRTYKDLSEATNLELGASFASGPNGTALGNRTELYGLDFTLRWKPLRRAIYQSFLLRSELYWSNRETEGPDQPAFGFYALAQKQLARRWFLGARYDQSERGDDPGATDRGGSLILTFWPSEFSQLRGQYRRTSYAFGATADELLMQVQFSLGAHGAHAF
ncbi:MAG TPA: hypothetical protein VGB99_01865 [Acidobacteriota bacterium]